MLTDALWRRSFAADPSVIGRAITLDDAVYTIVGVARPGGLEFMQNPEAFVATSARERRRSGGSRARR